MANDKTNSETNSKSEAKAPSAGVASIRKVRDVFNRIKYMTLAETKLVALQMREFNLLKRDVAIKLGEIEAAIAYQKAADAWEAVERAHTDSDAVSRA